MFCNFFFCASLIISFAKVIKSEHPDILVGDITKQTVLEKAKKDGHKIKYENLVRSVDRLPGADTRESNLFQKLNFRELQKHIKGDVSQGNKIHFQNTLNPIASYIMGNFGKDDNGNPVQFY